MTIWDMRDPADAAIARWIANNAGGDPVQATALASWLERNPVARRGVEAGYVVIPYLGWRLAGAGKVDLLPDGSLPPLGTGGRDYPMPHLARLPLHPMPLTPLVPKALVRRYMPRRGSRGSLSWRSCTAPSARPNSQPSSTGSGRLDACRCKRRSRPWRSTPRCRTKSNTRSPTGNGIDAQPRRRIKSGSAPGHRASSSSASRNIGYGARATARTAPWNGHRTSTYPRGSRRRETADGRAARRRCLYLDGHSEAGAPKIISRSNRL